MEQCSKAFLMGQTQPLFHLFSYFLISVKKNSVASRIRTQDVEGKDTDYYTTTTVHYCSKTSNCSCFFQLEMKKTLLVKRQSAFSLLFIILTTRLTKSNKEYIVDAILVKYQRDADTIFNKISTKAHLHLVQLKIISLNIFFLLNLKTSIESFFFSFCATFLDECARAQLSVLFRTSDTSCRS